MNRHDLPRAQSKLVDHAAMTDFFLAPPHSLAYRTAHADCGIAPKSGPPVGP
jgi:hypothetical protein